MARTLGYHVVISGYGLWLPGDDRGHWSEDWDAQIGFVEPHSLHVGDPVRLRVARERMKHPPVRLAPEMATAVIATIGRCAAESDWTILTASIEATHTHLLLTYSTRDIDTTIKWIKDHATKAVHAETSHAGPVWCKGRWRTFVFDPPRGKTRGHTSSGTTSAAVSARGRTTFSHKAATGGRGARSVGSRDHR
ncbi:MAG TPA: transposase [Pirellulales bacterium]